AIQNETGYAWKIQLEQSAGAAPEDLDFAEGGGGKPKSGGKEEAEKVPLVRRAMEVLGASIQRVDEGFQPISSNSPDTPGS
ncbi:MAG: hypothetical protein ACKO23_15355, partial [Gemmataceae bacterium]